MYFPQHIPENSSRTRRADIGSWSWESEAKHRSRQNETTLMDELAGEVGNKVRLNF